LTGEDSGEGEPCFYPENILAELEKQAKIPEPLWTWI